MKFTYSIFITCAIAVICISCGTNKKVNQSVA